MMARYSIHHEEWYPVLELHRDDKGNHEISDDLAERYDKALAEFISVQRELHSRGGDDLDPFWWKDAYHPDRPIPG